MQVWRCLRTATNIGREFTIATNQVDFTMPAKFGLTYRDKDNSNKTPLCIHRAPLGTHEIYIGFLIESRSGGTGAVSVRLHHGGPQGAKPKAEVVTEILAAIKERRA